MRFDFAKLEALRLLSRKILKDHATSLEHYEFDGGYGHLNNKKRSISSTATCVLSLVSRDLWPQDKATTRRLISYLLSKRTSADLKPDNPFTTAWIVEAVAALRGLSFPLSKKDNQRFQRKIKVLKNEITKGAGGVSMKPYPFSGYLTQLVVRALRNSDAFSGPKLEEQVCHWAWSELSNQLTLIQAESKSRDAFAVVYVLILATMLTPKKSITPEQSSIQRAAVKVFFDCQLPDGTWPLSRPLFHYPEIGNAYCYEYEMLTQLLQEEDLTDLLLDHLPEISNAVDAAVNTGYRLGARVQVWSSGHHPQVAEPESWSTASVYHFFYRLDRLLAEAVRRELFRHLELPVPTFSPPHTEKAEFAPRMLDSQVIVHDKRRSLKEFLWDSFVSPISSNASGIAKGVGLESGIPRSAIFFGPPGTSKTKLSEDIAAFLGWPFLSIDPSMLLRSGMDGIPVEANAIFRRLEQTEQVVVLLDEFDELVLDRDDAEQPSRLLTTSMLPKLARIHTAGTLVFIIATNNISRFDLAIRRRGRFDRLVQVMPPSARSKLRKTDWGDKKNVDISQKLAKLRIPIKGEVKKQLGALTFGECNSFATELASSSSKSEAVGLLSDFYKDCTLLMKAGTKDKKEETWEGRCKSEARLTS